jgi:hypothetical protein
VADAVGRTRGWIGGEARVCWPHLRGIPGGGCGPSGRPAHPTDGGDDHAGRRLAQFHRLAFVVHNELITKHGIFNHENLDFTDLLKDKVSEFGYVFAPLRIKCGTGSPGRPIAIV